MLSYPKIETLFNRDDKTHKVRDGEIRLPEFANVKNWWTTEKIDGTNLRLTYVKGQPVEINGRTDNADLPRPLLEYLVKTFPVEKFTTAFSDIKDNPLVTLYGEGYGPRINTGENYRTDGFSFRLFDVRVGEWWLEPQNIADVATKMGIKTVPAVGVMTLEDAVAFIKSKPRSRVTMEENPTRENTTMEGIVARSHPLMLRRNGERVIWKLKVKDFSGMSP